MTSSESPEPIRRLLMLAAVSVFLGIILLALPISGRTTTWTWAPGAADPASALAPIAADLPASLDAVIPCEAIRTNFFDTASNAEVLRIVGARDLVLAVSGTQLTVRFGDGQAIPVKAEIGDRPCEIRLQLDGGSEQIKLDTGVESKTFDIKSLPSSASPGPSFSVIGFLVDKRVRGSVDISMTTRPSTIAWDWWRWLLVAGIAAATVQAFRLLRTRKQSSNTSPARLKSSQSVAWSDVVLAAGAFVALFFLPPLSDDGWVLSTQRNYHPLGFFSNYFTAAAAPQPQGYWWQIIEQAWLAPLGTPLWFMRVPSLIIVVASWVALRRMILDRAFPDSRAIARTVGVCSAIVALFAWTPTLRPEPVVALLIVIQIALVWRYWKLAEGQVLLLIGVVAALGLALHQSGWTVVTCALALLPAIARNRSRWPIVGTVAALSGATLVGLLAMHSNLSVMMWANEQFTSQGFHNRAFDELARVVAFRSGQAPVREFAAVLIILGIIGFTVRPDRRADKDASILGWASICAIAGLILTSSKWIWHVAAVWPAVSLLLAICAISVQRRAEARSRSVMYATAGLVLTAGWFAAQFPGGWQRMGSITSDVELHYPPQAIPPDSIAFWVAVGTPVTLMFILILRRRKDFKRAVPVVASMIATTGLIIGTSIAPVVADVRFPNSWPSVVAHSSCGLAGPDGLAIPTVMTPLKVTSGPVTRESSGLALQRQDLPDTLSKFLPVRQSVWSASEGLGGGSTPWYQIESDLPIRAWFSVPVIKSVNLTFRWADSQRKELQETVVQRMGYPDAWNLIPVQPPEGATAVSISWTSAHGPDRVVAPVEVKNSAVLTELVGNGPTWQAPYTAMWATCLRLPDISTGIAEEFNWALAMPEDMQRWRVTALRPSTELTCLDAASGERLCVYSVHPPQSGYGITKTYGQARW